VAATMDIRTPKRSAFVKAIDKLYQNPLTAVSTTLATLIVLVAIFAPLLATHSPDVVNLVGRLAAPSAAHWFGTDEVGRDIFSRLIYGTRVSLGIGLGAVVLAGAVGTMLGSLAGYRGGWIDQVISRAMDILLAFPPLILAMALSAALGPSLMNAAIAITIVKFPIYVRLSRAEALSVSQQLYVRASKTFGLSTGWVLRRHVVPNLLSPIIVQTTLDLGDAILLIATLGFLGLGAQPPTPEWGSMISVGWRYLLDQWWYPTFTGAAIFITVMTFNLLGDGIRDLLTPTQGDD